MNNFDELNLPTALADSLTHMQFTKPTPIQAQSIPSAMEGHDILGSAQTGTGKTAAFMIPLIVRLMENPKAKALVMTPTRELAAQVMDMTRKLMGHNSGIRLALLIGGEPMPKQFNQLNNSPRLIIGTPGRINDHCRRNGKLLTNVDFLVLDEADRMLDMGFSVQIDEILRFMPRDRQTLMFSATFSDAIIRFAGKYLNDPVRVAVKADKVAADKIKHDVMHVSGKEKFALLQEELQSRSGSILIFVKTRRNADQIAKQLSAGATNDNRAEPIHGDLRQRQRDRTIKAFQTQKFRILVATDIAARGLDIPHIEHVINYDLPQNAEDYVHRIGRTARAGAEGSAVCFVTPQDGRMWRDIQRLVFPDQAPAKADKPQKSGKPRKFDKKGGYAKKSGKSPFKGIAKVSTGKDGEKRNSFKKKRDFRDDYDNRSENRGEEKKRSFRDDRDNRSRKDGEGKKRSFKGEASQGTEKKPYAAKPKKSFGSKPNGKPSGFKKSSDNAYRGGKRKPANAKPMGGNFRKKKTASHA